jgi:hypothetical protein
MPKPLVIIVEPVPERPGYFEARLDACLLVRSRQPLLDVARRLLTLGHSAHAAVEMKYIGSDTVCLSALVGTAAKLTVEDDRLGRPRFRRWRGPRSTGAAPPIAVSENSVLSVMGAAE